VASVASLRDRLGYAPFVLAAALPFLFLHRHYQPEVSAGRVNVFLSDLAVLAVVLAGAFESRHAPFLRALGAWLAWALLGAFVLLWTLWGAVHFPAYPAGTHAVTAAKWCEYMLLAPAVFAISRRRGALLPATFVLVAWSVAATIVGVLQFFGAFGNIDHTPAGGRKPSFLGDHDFGALSAAALVLALVVIARGARTTNERRFAAIAAASGVVGMVLAGAFDALVGVVLATILIAAAARVRETRRIALMAVLVLAVAVGTLAIRSRAVADGLKFLGLRHGSGGAAVAVQSYRQRALLAYIGGRIFLAHPVLGVGFEGSTDEYAYGPFVADAMKRFTQPAYAFPSPQHPWGVQNAYVQSLSDFGFLGLPVFLAALIVPVAIALRRGVGDRRLAGPALVLVCVGAWNGFGLVTGIPLAALTWLAVGVASAAVVRESLTHRG
jgi:hypothetical protein